MTPTILEDLTDVSYPTIGHFLEEGFVSPAIQSLLANVKIAGPAVTVRIAGHDAIAMNRALLALKPGDVLVVDMLGDHRHAPVGAVTAAAALAQVLPPSWLMAWPPTCWNCGKPACRCSPAGPRASPPSVSTGTDPP